MSYYTIEDATVKRNLKHNHGAAMVTNYMATLLACESLAKLLTEKSGIESLDGAVIGSVSGGGIRVVVCVEPDVPREATRTDQPDPPRNLTVQERAVLGLLSTESPRKGTVLAHRLNLSQGRVRSIMATLIRQGVVACVRGFGYLLTELGRACISQGPKEISPVINLGEAS